MRLNAEIERVGLWKCEEDIDQGLRKVFSEKEQKESLYNQLQFRKKVLNQLSPDPTFFQKSSQGRYFTIDEQRLINQFLKFLQKIL